MGSFCRACCRWVVMVLVSFFGADSACGIVLHPGDGEPNLGEWKDRPVGDVVGRWGSNASCVVVSDNCVLTTRHQGGGIGTSVEVGGVSYRVVKIWNHPGYVHPDNGEYAGVDLRIAQLGGAELEDYVVLHEGRREAEAGGIAVIGGWGVGRGETLESFSRTYGYAWEDLDGGANRQLRWCTNEIDSVELSYAEPGGDKAHSFVVADFDDPKTTEYEGVVAGYDSGGGWFVKGDSGWELVGLTWAVDGAESLEVCFRSKSMPWLPAPDRMYALRISSYAEWIRDVLARVCDEPLRADFSGDCVVDMADVMEFAVWWLEDGCSIGKDYCHGRDFDGDRRVDFADFGQFSEYFGIESKRSEASEVR